MNTAVIATTPGAMVESQGKLLAWIQQKLAVIDQERQTAESLLAQLRIARAATTHADKLLDSCRRRERFYEKVRHALEKGYYIIPPFDCQVFAIRTDREQPPRQEDEYRDKYSAPPMPTLPAGAGRYVAPIPARSLEHTFDEPISHKPSETREVKIFTNDSWLEVEFPVRAMKPELVEVTAEAMQAKIFDSFAIAPQYRAADPIIVGQIKHWKPNHLPLTFFVAWWLDYDDL